MKNDNYTYSHIESFQDLEIEKMHLTYEVRLARRKIDLAVIELGAALSPVRLLSTLLVEWMRPISAGIKSWLEDFFSKRHHSK